MDVSTESSINLPISHDNCVSHMEYIPLTTAGSTSWYEYNNFKSLLVFLVEPTPLLALPQSPDVTMLSKVITNQKGKTGAMSREKSSGMIKCNDCDRFFTDSSNLSAHHRLHTGVKPYKCDECEISFAQRSQLNVHKRRHTSGKPYKPRGNYKAFKHNGMYKCNVCGGLFKHTSNLVTHLRTHTGEKPYKCSECGDSFTQSSNLKAHKLIHAGIKPYVCSECGKSFYRSTHLTSHLRIHQGNRPYTCNFCQKQFFTSTHLKYHVRIHTGERPFTCLICEVSFRDKNTLKVHMKIHTEERPFKCIDCGKIFKSKPALNQHKKLHLNKGLYSCEKCHKSFKASIYLKKHLSKMCDAAQPGKRGYSHKPTTKENFMLPSSSIYQLTVKEEQHQMMNLGDVYNQRENCCLNQQIKQNQIQIYAVPNTEPESVVIYLQKQATNDEQIDVFCIEQDSYWDMHNCI